MWVALSWFKEPFSFSGNTDTVFFEHKQASKDCINVLDSRLMRISEAVGCCWCEAFEPTR